MQRPALRDMSLAVRDYVTQIEDTNTELLEILDDIGKHSVSNNHGSFDVSADRIREIRKIAKEQLPR